VYTGVMLLTNKPETKEIIVTLLSKGALGSIELQQQVEAQKKVTKQGFYKALRELIKDEVVAKNKHLVILNNAWVNKLHELAQTVDQSYQIQAEGSFLSLEEGESLVYHFKSLPSLDVLWMHYFYIIAKKEKDEDVIFYNAHEFWSLFRFAEENAMYEWIGNNKRKAYEVIGGNTDLDRSTTAYMKKYGLELAHEAKMSYQKNYFTSVIGDYILNTIIDMNTAIAIDNLYAKHKEWNDDVAKELADILSRLKRSKVVIERNKTKAEQIRKKLMGYFTFYK
jgi:hypothetical protein